MKALKIQSDGSLKLPPEILQRFPKASELVVWTDGDTIVLKRLRPLNPSQFAEREPEEEMSLEEIAAEVHQIRREKWDRHSKQS